MSDHDASADLAAALSDPLRLDILRRLMEGPATVSDIVATTGEAQSKISNHLAVLRARRLVAARRTGRQIAYSLSSPSVAQIVESLEAIAGSRTQRPSPDDPLSEARTCYDHLAGRLGVAIFDRLIVEGALKPARRAGGDLQPGPAAHSTFAALGMDTKLRRKSRRRAAFACLDWTERRPHLGGHLGAALCEGALEAGWVERQPGTRAVRVTLHGQRSFRCLLGLKLAPKR